MNKWISTVAGIAALGIVGAAVVPNWTEAQDVAAARAPVDVEFRSGTVVIERTAGKEAVVPTTVASRAAKCCRPRWC